MATQALLFLCCVALRAKTYLAPSVVNEWGFSQFRRKVMLKRTLKIDSLLDYGPIFDQNMSKTASMKRMRFLNSLCKKIVTVKSEIKAAPD